MAENEITEESERLLPCSICSRTFRAGILDRHEKVCEKTLSKKRKVFDSFKARVQGTELAEFLGPAPLPGQPPRVPPKAEHKEPEKKSTKLPKWKQTHEALIATLRAARGVETPADSTTRQALTLLVASDNEQCPTCGRCFGPRAYDRHVEFCREMMSRKARTPPKDNAAHERMAARTKYRAPMLVKRPRTDATPVSKPVKEVRETVRPVSVKPAPVTPGPTRRAPAVVTSAPATAVGNRSTPALSTVKRVPPTTSQFPRSSQTQPEVSTSSLNRSTLRSSVRGRTASISRRATSPIKKASKNEEPKIKLNLGKVESTPSTNLNNTYSKATMETITAAAEQQMRDLLSWSSDSDLSTLPKPIHSRPSPQTNLPQIQNQKSLTPSSASPLQASPTSAFTPVLSNSRYIDENDNSMLGSSDTWRHGYDIATSTPKPKPAPRTPATIRRSLDNSRGADSRRDKRFSDNLDNSRDRDSLLRGRVGSRKDKTDRYSGVSNSSQRSDETLADEVLFADSQLAAYGQSLARIRKKTLARSKSVFEDRNRMLFLQTYEPGNTSSDEEEDLELRERQRHYSSSSSHPPLIPPSPHSSISHYRPSSPVFEPSTMAKDVAFGGGDSAYSSLNRRSPRDQEEHQGQAEKKFSKFCHDCGAKYPLVAAKFCCECGVRRLVI